MASKMPPPKVPAKVPAKAPAKAPAKREMMGPPAVIRSDINTKNNLRKKLMPVASPSIRKDQNDFLRKVAATPYKMTAEEKKALESIRKARESVGSNLVGAKIVGRKKVGPKKVGPKKAAAPKMPKGLPGSGSKSGMAKRGPMRPMM